MTQITFIDPQGTKTTATATPGDSVMQTAVAAGIAGISADCGGACACGTCHCYVMEGGAVLPAPEADEADMLDCVIAPTDTSRLTCQIKVTDALDGLVLQVPESQI